VREEVAVASEKGAADGLQLASRCWGVEDGSTCPCAQRRARVGRSPWLSPMLLGGGLFEYPTPRVNKSSTTSVPGTTTTQDRLNMV
jgi:hypothetical protein